MIFNRKRLKPELTNDPPVGTRGEGGGGGGGSTGRTAFSRVGCWELVGEGLSPIPFRENTVISRSNGSLLCDTSVNKKTDYW